MNLLLKMYVVFFIVTCKFELSLISALYLSAAFSSVAAITQV
jgi:hypothetical protein